MGRIFLLVAVLAFAGLSLADDAADRTAAAQRRLAEKQAAAKFAATRPASQPASKPAALPLGSREKPYTVQTLNAAMPADLRETAENANNEILANRRDKWIEDNLMDRWATITGKVQSVQADPAGNPVIDIDITAATSGKITCVAAMEGKAGKLKDGSTITGLGKIKYISFAKGGLRRVAVIDGSF